MVDGSDQGVKRDSAVNSKGWSDFTKALRQNGIVDPQACWYVIWVKRFKATAPAVPLGDALLAHLERVRAMHERDAARGFGEAPLPEGVAARSPNAAREWPWQFVFPAPRLAVADNDGRVLRPHLCETVLQKYVRGAGRGLRPPEHLEEVLLVAVDDLLLAEALNGDLAGAS